MTSAITKNMVSSLSKDQRIFRGDGMPTYMKLIDGRWYSNVRDKKDWKRIHVVPLNAYEHEIRKASIQLGKVIADIEQGLDPSSARRKIKSLKINREVSKRMELSLRVHVYPFFGEYTLRDITKELLESYIEFRYGLSKDGELQGVKDTLDKEFDALTALLRVADKKWGRPKLTYKKIKRKILAPLTEAQVHMVADYLADKYKPIYWIMALTGMDVSDAVNLKPCHISKGWIDKPRGKVDHENGERIVVPILQALKVQLDTVPWPMDADAILFPNIKPKAVTTAVLRAFTDAGMKGYGAKYLRRHIGSALCDEGFGDEWIGKILSHAEGSRVTGRYTQTYKNSVMKAFKKLEQRGRNVEGAVSKSE